MRKVADYGLALGIPIHSHIALNYVLTDYIPKASQGAVVRAAGLRCLKANTHTPGAARWGVLGLSAVTCAGLLRLNMSGPGVTQTVKDLWGK